MGLDMMLYRQHYIADRPWSDADSAPGTGAIEALGLVPGISLAIPPESLGQTGGATLTIEIQVAYWRKANAIHGWFVNQLANGVDECQPIYVSRDHIVALRNACQMVLAAKGTPEEDDEIEEYLPPTGGFFFGSTEADEWYWDQARRTHDLLSWLLKHDTPDAEYEYRASW